MDKVKLLLEFIDNNRLLSFLGGLAIFLTTILLFSSNSMKFENQTSTAIVKDYQVLVNNNDYKYYTYLNKYYVFVSNPAKIEKSLIRQELEIPENIEFEVLLPGMAYLENISPIPSPSVTN